MLVQVVIECAGRTERREMEVSNGVVTIGRAPTCSLSFESALVSRNHASVDLNGAADARHRFVHERNARWKRLRSERGAGVAAGRADRRRRVHALDRPCGSLPAPPSPNGLPQTHAPTPQRDVEADDSARVPSSCTKGARRRKRRRSRPPPRVTERASVPRSRPRRSRAARTSPSAARFTSSSSITSTSRPSSRRSSRTLRSDRRS